MGERYYDLDSKIVASGIASIKNNNKVLWRKLGCNGFDDDGKSITLNSLKHLWENKKGVLTLFIEFGLWSHIYTLQEDGKWKLTKRGKGYA